MIGQAIVRQLLCDPDFEVRVCDQRDAPDWIREGAEVHTGDLRDGRACARRTRRRHARDPLRRDRRRDRELPPPALHADRGQQRPLQQRDRRGAARAGRALRLHLELDGVRTRHAVPDPGGSPARLPSAALGLRLLEADRRGLLPRGPRAARAAVHDLPPVQRLRARRGGDRRTGDRACRAGPDPQGARRAAAAADLRLRRADPHADPRRRHRLRRDRGAALPGGTERGLQHLGRPASSASSRSRGPSGRPAARTRRPSRWSTCRPSPSMCSAAGHRSRRPGGCWAGRRRSSRTEGIAATVRWLRERELATP